MSVQAQEKSFELHSLGWKAFQDLCITIASEVLGYSIQMFSPIKDGGRDGAFHGKCKIGKFAGVSGSFTVQCKHSSKRDEYISLSKLKDELVKARRIANRGLADNYILMINSKVTGKAEETIRKAFLSIPKIRHFILFGSEWINQNIIESKRLRMLVPRVYGLGDLSQILDERKYAQAQEILGSMRENISKFVITEAYEQSAKALVDHGFVLLLGEPASGKTTIASSLALGALDYLGCSTMIIKNADEFSNHWNPNEPRQFFWVDDAFGTTQYQQMAAYQWNKVFHHINAAIKQGARILFTSRDYIYRAALSDLKTDAFPFIKQSQVIIYVQNLSILEKEQILYNHIKLGDQSLSYRRAIKPYLHLVASNSRFLPEIARRLGNTIFTKDLSIRPDSIIEFTEKPLQFLVDILRTLDPASRAALTLLYMNGGSLDSPISPSKSDKKTLESLGVDQASVRKAFKHMDGSLTLLIRTQGISRWIFKHPTIGDAIADITIEDPELLDIYLVGTPINKLLGEVTCGDVKYEGVKVIIPQNRYDEFIGRLDTSDNYDTIITFLANRCDRSFLQKYIGVHKKIYEQACNPRPYIGATPDAALVARLHEFNLLPEQWRQRFIDNVERLAIDVQDLDFLNIPRIKQVLNEQEIVRVIRKVYDQLLPAFSSVVEDWESNYSPDRESPEQYYGLLVDALKTLGEELSLHQIPDDLIDQALSEINGSIDYLNESYNEPDYDAYYEDYQLNKMESSSTNERSIFDDIDT